MGACRPKRESGNDDRHPSWQPDSCGTAPAAAQRGLVCQGDGLHTRQHVQHPQTKTSQFGVPSPRLGETPSRFLSGRFGNASSCCQTMCRRNACRRMNPTLMRFVKAVLQHFTFWKTPEDFR